MEAKSLLAGPLLVAKPAISIAQRARCTSVRAQRLLGRLERARTIPSDARRRQLVVKAGADGDNFVWKGGGSGLAEVWEGPGLYVEAPKGSGVEWFFLDVGPKNSKSPPVLLVHGIPAYSFMWRDVIPALTAAGRRCIAVDLPGFGNSTMMQVGAGFDYTFADYDKALESLVERLELTAKGPIEVVGQGLVGGTVAARWAGMNPSLVSKLTLMNTPLDKQSAGEVFALKPLTNPFTAAITCQNPLNVVGKPIEASGPYSLGVEDQAAYMAPTLKDGNAGFIVMAAVKEIKKNGPKAVEEALQLLASQGVKVEVIWGASDTWLGSKPPPLGNLDAEVKILEGAGHFAAEDWSEKVANALLGRKYD